MKRFFMYFVFLLVASITLSCATALTKQGETVKLLMKEEAPKEYELINDIETSLFGEPSVISVKNTLRNKAAEVGGNLVVVDTIEMHQEDSRTWYTGNGRAYKLKK